MPLQWRISRLEHVVLSVADGTVTRADIEAYLDALEEKGALPWHKIFVAHSGTLDLSASDLSWLSERLTALNDKGPLGPFAVVAAPDRNGDFMRFFMALAGVKRRLRLFRTIHDARRWLDRQRERPLKGKQIAVRALPLR